MMMMMMMTDRLIKRPSSEYFRRLL